MVGTVIGALWVWALAGESSDFYWLPLAWTGLAVLDARWLWLGLGCAIPLIGLERRRPNRHLLDKQRQGLVQLWFLVGLYLSAGMGLWAALEEAAEAVPMVKSVVRQLGVLVASVRDPAVVVTKFSASIPGPEAELLATMVDHGYRHGILSADVIRQAEDLENRLAFERELRRRQDPLWLSIVPAILLLNVLVILGLPMAISMLHAWHGI
jgi:hypothetical protein